jgi:Phosphotransferase enzyme family
MYTGTLESHLDTDIIARILTARGFSVIGKLRKSWCPRSESLMTADAFDKTGRKVSIKVGKNCLLRPSRLHTSYRLLLWLRQSNFSNSVVTFPEGLGYFRQKGLSFLVLEFVEHRDVWNSKTPLEKFQHFTEVIVALQKISGCPSFLERHDHRTVIKTLTRYAKYICRQATSVDPATVTEIIELFRSNWQLFDRFYGVSSHNDIHATNLLCRSDGEGPRFYLIDVETCRLASQFSDFARCYNREMLTRARMRYSNSETMGDVECVDSYGLVSRLYNDDKQARMMFDVMILVDSLMHLYWTLNHETDIESRAFVERLFSRVTLERLDHLRALSSVRRSF